MKKISEVDNVVYVRTEDVQREEIEKLKNKISFLEGIQVNKERRIFILGLTVFIGIVVLIIKEVIPDILVLFIIIGVVTYFFVIFSYGKDNEVSFAKKIIYIVAHKRKNLLVFMLIVSTYLTFMIYTGMYKTKHYPDEFWEAYDNNPNLDSGR